jgi:hypothetical protein
VIDLLNLPLADLRPTPAPGSSDPDFLAGQHGAPEAKPPA